MWQEQSWPLIGRAAELAELNWIARDADSPGVVFAGPAGVGKTRLARVAADLLAGTGARVVRAAASRSAAGLPFGALAGVLPEEPGGPLDGPVARGLRALRGLTADRLVLVVDDAHLLDDASAALVHQAVAQRIATVVGSVRTGEPLPDAVAALWRDAGVHRVDLGPLSEADVMELVLAVLGGPVDGAALRRIWLLTQGNALFLRELVVSARQAGMLAADGGVWHLTGPLRTAARLTELLEARLAGTTAAERDALELLSVAEPVGLSLLAKLVAPDVVESLERARLVEVRPDGRRVEVRLAHPLYAELLRAQMPAIAALRHNRVIAETVEALPPKRREDVLRLAVWRLDGGGEAVPELLLAAAHRAELARDAALSERLARRAYESGGGLPATLALAGALFALGRYDEAEQLLAAAPTAGDEELAAVATLRWIVRSQGHDDTAGARDLLARARQAVHDPAVRAQLSAAYAQNATFTLDLPEAARVAGELLDSTGGEMMARLALSASYLLTGDLVRSAEADAEWERAAAVPGLVWATQGRVGWRIILLTGLPDLDAAQAFADTFYTEALQTHSASPQAWGALARARVALVRGRLAAAADAAREACVLFARLNQRAPRRFAAGLAMLAHAQRGDRAGCEAAAAELAECAGGPARVRILDPDVVRARAWQLAAADDLPGARRVLADEIAEIASKGAAGLCAGYALDLVRLGDPGAASDILERLPPPADWPLGRVTVRFARAATAGHPQELLGCADTFEDFGMLLYAAEAAALGAAALRTAGDGRAAARAAGRAGALALRCEGPDTPALRRAGPAAVLSPREYDVAMLAARGDSNRAIAEALHLSERTVENHLQRSYTKLGIRGRSGLAGALRDAGAPA